MGDWRKMRDSKIVRSPPHRAEGLAPEIWTCIVFGVVWTAGVAAGLPVSLPDRSGLAFVVIHYLRPLIYASAVQLGLAVFARYRDIGRTSEDPYLMLKLLPVLVIAVFINFNFKAWMPLVSPHLYDPTYHRMDLAAEPVVEFFHIVRGAIAGALPISVDAGYSAIFIAMFVVSITVHAIADSTGGQRRLILGICMILLVGGLAYWIAPAAGPFIYERGANAVAAAQQESMYRAFRYVQTTGTLPAGYFVMPVAAMPSLHLAHTLFLTLSAASVARWLLVLYVPVLLWMTIESVVSGWHYLIDVPAGVALALCCLVLARASIPPGPEDLARSFHREAE